MDPHRPRKPRTESGALVLLAEWRNYVEGAERDDGWRVVNLPCCYHGGLDARARLESLMHNGGRRIHRLCAEVTALDERFRAVTVERGAWRAAPWWERRLPR